MVEEVEVEVAVEVAVAVAEVAEGLALPLECGAALFASFGGDRANRRLGQSQLQAQWLLRLGSLPQE